MKVWQKHFTERQLKEIEFCCVYKKFFGHGTDGHNMRIVIAEMAALLDAGLVPLVVNLPEDATKSNENDAGKL